MPIRPDLRHHYRGAAWRETRARILARANDCCEKCKVPNARAVIRYRRFPGWWFEYETGAAHDPKGVIQVHVRGSEMPDDYDIVQIRLGIAHLNHDPSDNRDDNLRALCARCHFIHDQDKHAETRSTRKDATRPLLTSGATEVRE